MNKNEWTHEIMNHIDPTLIEQADTHVHRRLPRAGKIALIAACLCAVLVGGAFAAEAVTGLIREYYSGQQFVEVIQSLDPMYPADTDDSYAGYVIQREDSGISLENVSDDVLSFAQQCKADGKAASTTFASAKEMEAFVGLDLYDSEVLDMLTQADSTDDAHATLKCASDEDGLTYIEMMTYYGLDNGNTVVTVTAEAIRTGQQNGDIAYTYPDGTLFTEEVYTSARGEAIVIIRCDCPAAGGTGRYTTTPWDDGYTEYVAHFYIGGVRYCVDVASAENPAHALSTLKEVLDAFQ